MLRKIFLMILAMSAMLNAEALTLKDAKDLYLKGEYSKALPEFEKEYKKSPRNASVNHWLGVCYFYEGNYKKAEKYLIFADKKGVQESSFYLAKIYNLQYDSEDAIEYADRYESLLAKAKKTVSPERQKELDVIRRAASMLDHVENIEVIDSITVDKDTFFSYYKISPESGYLESAEVLPQGSEHNTDVVFMPETRQRMMWTQTDSTGMSHLVESTKLIDGSWDKPRNVGDDLGEGGNVLYPFMMPDGATLYYSSNGEGSIGGYDIFMTRRDAETMEYYKPQNVGFPYNSPYDDYLLAIDEFTGAGWWATDRNQIEGKLTIYIFKPQAVRENYNAENPNLASLAAMHSIKDTWRDGADYSSLLSAIASITTGTKEQKKEFEFEFADGRVYYAMSDFHNAEARKQMSALLQQQKTFASKCLKLEELRGQYAKRSSASLGNTILQLEREVEALRTQMQTTTNAIISKEK